MQKWHNFLQFISYSLLIVAVALWGFTMYKWIKTGLDFDSWNTLAAAAISSLLSLISFLKSYNPKNNQGKISMTSQSSNTDLHRLLNKHLNDDELRTLCLYLNLDYDNLGGGSKSARLRELILYVERHGKTAELISAISTHYPNIPI